LRQATLSSAACLRSDTAPGTSSPTSRGRRHMGRERSRRRRSEHKTNEGLPTAMLLCSPVHRLGRASRQT
jgi:hypothetical protein